jgi:hypothetical protein
VVCYPTPTGITCCTPRGGSLGCVNYPGNLYPLKGAVWNGVQILFPHIPVSSTSGSPAAGILGNKLVTIVIAYVFLHCLHSCADERSYMASYLCSLRFVPWASVVLRGSTLVVEDCDDKEVVQSMSHGPLGEVFRLQCDS